MILKKPLFIDPLGVNCGKLLKGLRKQGFYCMKCNNAVHKTCMAKLEKEKMFAG